MRNEVTGQRIRERRQELNISAVEIAERTGLSKATIHRYESGDIKQIKLPTVELIAGILKVDPLWLIGKSESKLLMSDNSTNDVLVMLDNLIRHIQAETVLYAGSHKLEADKRNMILSGLNLIRNMTQQ